MQRIGGSQSKGLIIGVLVLLALAFFVFRGCSGITGGIPQTGDGAGQASQSEGRLGQAYVTDRISSNGCPDGTARILQSRDTIYAGYAESDIPSGTSIFARLSREGRPVEDTEAITADRDMRTCVYFQFQPASSGFEPGRYTVDLYINGNAADQVEFTVADGQGGLLPAPGSQQDASSVELGRLSATTRVDGDGCPTDQVGSFRPDEQIYVAFDRSFIPRGSEIFARLLYEGRSIEDTQPLRADQDMDTCFWFVFEPARVDFEPGLYETQIYVNGAVADQIQFEVR